ncbi:unnamed protein product [Malus baccata var. baccata]|uniref:RRM domain-containing protein n=1 Tax=Malus baccata TaxID=106549 RepID=A0A540MYG2_MALBA|nr:hypothetical protein C1H46_010606 [Malus baccata]
MTAPSSSTFFTSAGVPQAPVPVSQQEFTLFHKVDRKVFSRLTFVLGRDPGESAQIVALWMWLEHAGKEYNFVHKLCSNLPDTLLSAVAEESVVALNCVQNDDFYPDFSNHDIPLLNALTNSDVTLKYFHQNRLGIIRGVTKLLNEVCMRAFDDLLPKRHPNNAQEILLNPALIGDQNNVMPQYHVNPLHNPLMHNDVPYDVASGSNMRSFVPNQRMHGVVNDHHQQFMGPQHINLLTRAVMRSDASLDYLRGVFDPYDLAVQRHILNNEMSDMLNNLSLNGGGYRGEAEEVSADERTIFLTFSKGYPISENEVKEYFSRKFGDFIESVFMQEVTGDDQPLYARLVVRSASSIPVVLNGKSKAKFSINGKHVWARKYVRKPTPGEPSSPRTVAPTHQV